MRAYELIKEYYGTNTAKRHGIPLIDHIDMGINILNELGASAEAIEAYCLHPIFQSDEAFNENLDIDLSGVSTKAIMLTIEYRRVANSYLRDKPMDNFVGFTNIDIYHMLYADKYQNDWSFTKYHEGNRPDSTELREYFDNWKNILLKNYENM